MRKQLATTITMALVFIFVLGLIACIATDEEETGTLSVQLTDAPFPTAEVAEANVTITKLEAREAGGGDGSPYLTLSEETQAYNLLDLRNGVTASLTELDILAGDYDLFRLYVSEGSVVMKDGTVHNLTVPSGAQTGIKLFIDPAIEVVNGLTADLLLDFDVEKSFVPQGAMNNIVGFIFKPVIRAVNASTVGRVAGSVIDTSAVVLADARVWVAQDTVISTTYTDTEGNYTILGLAAGTYTANAALAGYDTVSVAVEVVAGSQTTATFELAHQ